MSPMQLPNNCQGEESNEKEQGCSSNMMTIWYKFDTDSADAQFRTCITNRVKGECLLQEEAAKLILNSAFGDVHPCKLEILSWKVDSIGDYYLNCKRDYKDKFTSGASRATQKNAIPVFKIQEKPKPKPRTPPPRKRRWRSRSRSPPPRRRWNKKRRWKRRRWR